MSSKPAVVLCLVLACLGVNAHHSGSGSAPLAHRTHEAQHSLNSLPSHCSTGATELILAEETRVAELIKTCSKRSILFHLSEVITDTAYYGFNVYNNGMTIYTDAKVCLKEKYLFERLFCVFRRSPGAVKSLVELAMGTVSYLLEAKDLMPKVLSEIKDCVTSSSTEYQRFLDGVVKKAVMC